MNTTAREKKKSRPKATQETVPTVEVVVEFTLGGEDFDAVRVKWTDETAPTREQAIRVADRDGKVVRTDDQWSYVYEHRHQLPYKLNSYLLITAFPIPDLPRLVSCLIRNEQEWCPGGDRLADLLDEDVLVLRRRT